MGQGLIIDKQTNKQNQTKPNQSPLKEPKRQKTQNNSSHLTLNMTLISSPIGSAFTIVTFRGIALELKKEHDCKHNTEH